MVEQQKYRPTVINGQGFINADCMGKVTADMQTDDRQSKVLVVPSINKNKFMEGFCGYLFEEDIIPEYQYRYLIENNIPFLLQVPNVKTLIENDVIEIHREQNIARVLFRADSEDNTLVVTNQCNSNCIMCPDAFKVRQEKRDFQIDKLVKLIGLIDKHTRHLCITGGEPTLLQNELFLVLEACKRKLPETHFTMLTNGRMFYYKQYAVKFNHSRPAHMLIGIPIHAHTPDIHDEITNTQGSFIQTYRGIQNLYQLGENIEIRVVVSKLNYRILPNIAQLIVNNFPNIARVNLMGLEMLGNAIINKENVWIDFEELQHYLEITGIYLMQNGIQALLYNYPLCCISQKLWPICVKSISDYKIRYFEECNRCSVREQCGGLFNSTINIPSIKVRPIKRGSNHD